jgi:thioredoxin reductase (NADPH)
MLERTSQSAFDVAIGGGGPAGLAAAVYLGRFPRSVVVFDAGDARAKLIPQGRNWPGFPKGIAGEDLIRRLQRQSGDYGAVIQESGVEHIGGCAGSFELRHENGIATASLLILATGVVDKAPAIGGLRAAIGAVLIRLCPVCDAFEAAGQRIGVVGPEGSALREALFLRDYSPHVSILCNFPKDIGDDARMEAAVAGI